MKRNPDFIRSYDDDFEIGRQIAQGAIDAHRKQGDEEAEYKELVNKLPDKTALIQLRRDARVPAKISRSEKGRKGT